MSATKDQIRERIDLFKAEIMQLRRIVEEAEAELLLLEEMFNALEPDDDSGSAGGPESVGRRSASAVHDHWVDSESETKP